MNFEHFYKRVFPMHEYRDVSSVELLMKYHQGIRAEIETRGPKFNDCVALGRTLLAQKHRDANEVIRYSTIGAFIFGSVVWVSKKIDLVNL